MRRGRFLKTRVMIRGTCLEFLLRFQCGILGRPIVGLLDLLFDLVQ